MGLLWQFDDIYFGTKKLLTTEFGIIWYPAFAAYFNHTS